MSEHRPIIVDGDLGPSARLDDYLAGFAARLRRMHLLRALAAVALALLLLTLGGVFLAIQRGFAASLINGTRIALLLAVTALLLVLLVRPWRRLARYLAGDVERLTPEFHGRVTTWMDASSRGNPLRELLAEDTLAIAQQHGAEQQVRRWMLAVPAAVAALATGVLLWLAFAGPGLYGYGVRYVYAGWAVSGLLPDQGLLVTPGNQVVRRGGSVPVLAKAHGFDPTTARIHARVGIGNWQDVDMSRTVRGFEFSFLSVREPLQYYVDAAGVRSATYNVEVVEVPTVENVRLVYNYPSWTRRKNEVRDPGGDVAGVAGTEVQLEIKTDRPIGDGKLVLNGKDSALDGSGTTTRSSFKISEDGRYYLAARVGDETVRLTDDYLIKLVPDNKPEIKIVKPGRDFNASNIEEVTARVQATDDFALENVELRYAVNGGAWQSIPLRAGGERVDSSQVLMLEQMRAAAEDRALAPGDLIAYYATARDRAQSAQTDMYFVEVRPFDRRYTESQQRGGGGGGGGSGSEQAEISKRQKEILVSTWNLIRQKGDPAPQRAAAVRDNSQLLAEIQEKLAAQAQTLAERTQSRALADGDGEVKRFLGFMQEAIKAMKPATERLAAVDLDKAIQPEQQALQALLRAEAVFSDLQVSRQRGNGGNGGGQASMDLAQLYELEMDLEKNQYESGNSASPEADAEQNDELARKLQELARRQEQLANEARRQQALTDDQRWQQETLRREAEQLRQQLQNQQQQQANNQSGQQNGQQNGQQGSSQSASNSRAAQRLDQAIAAMNRASEAMRNNSSDPAGQREQLQRAAGEAQQQLAGASQQLSQQRQDSLRAQLADLGQRAESAYSAQAAVEQRLQDSASKSARERGRADLGAGLNEAQRRELAADKRTLGADVQRMEQDLSEAARRWRNDSPRAADSLQQAAQLLTQNAIQSQLAQGARYIENGQAAYVVPRESGVTDTLRDVRDELRSAQTPENAQSQRNDRALSDALARVQSLRQQVQQLANANAQGQAPQQQGQQGQGQQGQQGQQSQQGQGQQGQQGQQSQQGQGQQGQQGQQSQQGQSQGQQGQQGQGGVGGAALAGVRRALNSTGQQLGGIGSVLRGQGTSAEAAEQVQDLARQLRATDLGGRGEQLTRQLTASLALLEQLELRLAQSTRGNARGAVRTAVTEPVAEEYKDAVAEYFRQLSRD